MFSFLTYDYARSVVLGQRPTVCWMALTCPVGDTFLLLIGDGGEGGRLCAEAQLSRVSQLPLQQRQCSAVMVYNILAPRVLWQGSRPGLSGLSTLKGRAGGCGPKRPICEAGQRAAVSLRAVPSRKVLSLLKKTRTKQNKTTQIDANLNSRDRLG